MTVKAYINQVYMKDTIRHFYVRDRVFEFYLFGNNFIAISLKLCQIGKKGL